MKKFEMDAQDEKYLHEKNMEKLETFAALCREQRRLETKLSGAHSRAWDYLGRTVYETAAQSVPRIAFKIREVERAKKALLK